MGPNRKWMFRFTTRRTNDVPQQRELRVVFVGCTAWSLHTAAYRPPRSAAPQRQRQVLKLRYARMGTSHETPVCAV